MTTNQVNGANPSTANNQLNQTQQYTNYLLQRPGPYIPPQNRCLPPVFMPQPLPPAQVDSSQITEIIERTIGAVLKPIIELFTQLLQSITGQAAANQNGAVNGQGGVAGGEGAGNVPQSTQAPTQESVASANGQPSMPAADDFTTKFKEILSTVGEKLTGLLEGTLGLGSGVKDIAKKGKEVLALFKDLGKLVKKFIPKPFKIVGGLVNKAKKFFKKLF